MTPGRLTWLAAFPLFAVAALLALYGFFALNFNDGDGATYVEIAGQRLDAHFVGGIALAAAALLTAVGVVVARGRGTRR